MSQSQKNNRRHFTPQDKVALLKRHLLEGVPVSNLCDEAGIAPTQFYRWQKEFFENGFRTFENGRKAKAHHDASQKKIKNLEDKLARKNEVMAELLEEHTGFPMIPAMRSSTSSATGIKKPKFRPEGFVLGSASAPASSMTGNKVLAKSTSTTVSPRTPPNSATAQGPIDFKSQYAIFKTLTQEPTGNCSAASRQDDFAGGVGNVWP